MMPFHSWLPAAMVAPTPVSALLHAVAVVKMGVFGVCRVVLPRLRHGPARRTSGCTTCSSSDGLLHDRGRVARRALVQDNLKRRLAYSTISQLSYVLLGRRRCSTPAAAVGGVAHIGVPRRSRRSRSSSPRARSTSRIPQDEGQRARRHRPAHADHDDRLRHRRAVDDRPAARRPASSASGGS